MTTLISAHTPERIPAVRELFTEYQRWLGLSLCFQGFDAELAGLPGKYAPPAGRLYLAEHDGAVAGCIALRPMEEEGCCEMKRLFVREAVRGHGIGRLLAERTVADARALGYRTMKLDTLQRMESARSLYASLGFAAVPAYYENPMDEVVYMELALR